ncbi:MAG: hypothetical protein MZU84_04115 [Sphingobacterium sp.]|nr:hypothetical protein [Sphingobacterium sp.]
MHLVAEGGKVVLGALEPAVLVELRDEHRDRGTPDFERFKYTHLRPDLTS